MLFQLMGIFMFKDLKFVKIILFLILAVVIVMNQINEHKNTEFIFNPLSYKSQDSLSFLVASNSYRNNYHFKLENIISNQVMFDSSLTINKSYDYFNQNNFLTNGYPIISMKIGGVNLSSGIYSINRQNPFVVSGHENSEVTFVFPTANNLFYKAENDKKIFEIDSSYVSVNRPIELDLWTKGLTNFFQQITEKHITNYITDLDLENYSSFSKTKILVLYGRLVFWSAEMISNVESFIAKGGHLMIVSSDIFYAKFCFDKVNNRLEVAACKSFEAFPESKLQGWNNNSVDTTYETMRYFFHSNYGGENTKRTSVKIKEPEHPIFQDINIIEVSKALDIGENYLGVPNIEKGSVGYLSRRMAQISILAQTDCKVLGLNNKLGGVFEFQKINGGKAIVIGTSDLCLKESQQKESIQKLFSNTIDYLIKN